MVAHESPWRHTFVAAVAVVGVLVGAAACERPVTETAEEVEPAATETVAESAETAPIPASDLVERADAAAEVITAERLRDHVAALSADAMEGRGPGSAGDEKARDYLIDQMRQIGLTPGAEDGGWQQSFEMVGVTTDVPETWSFASGDESVNLQETEDFIAFSGVQRDSASIEDAELVFVGYGIQAPEYDWDDYGSADLDGKVVLMLNNDPDWDPELFEGDRRLYYGRWTYKYEKAAELGAAGAIIMHTTPSAGYPFQVVQTSWTGEQFELPATGSPRIEVGAWTTEEATRELLGLTEHELDGLVESARSRDFEPVPLGVTTSIALDNEIRRVETANVLGLLEGSDPELSDEVVVYTAHHDHLGVGEPDEEGDRIYNGALDNSAGSAQVLAIARAFQALPEKPRRSVLFAFVGAEEQGLLGSKYYAAHPTFPPGKIAAVLNYDGGNIWGETADVTFIGYEKSSLGRIVDHFAERQGRTVKADQFPDRGYFYRSDQFSLAKIGVPGVYLDTGTDFVGRPEGWGQERLEEWESEHYHQRSDELTDEWDLTGMLDDARLGFFSGVQIAEQDPLPSWVPGDEFEAAREEALAAVEDGGDDSETETPTEGS